MSRRAIGWILVAAFSIVAGHMAWRVLFGTQTKAEFIIGGHVTALGHPDRNAKNLYLRRELFFAEKPDHAWIEVLSRDRLRLIVNGEHVAKRREDGFAVGILANCTSLLKVGKNVIAISVEQQTAGRPPAVAVRGAYTQSDGIHRFGADDRWRVSTLFERNSHWWFAARFDDTAWTRPTLKPDRLRVKLEQPPRAVTTPSWSSWIMPAAGRADWQSIRREFEILAQPRYAWMRVTTNACYRLAVNGRVVVREEEQAGTTCAVPIVERTYDVTPLVQRGHNSLALLLNSPTGAPGALVDIEVEDTSGRRYRPGSDTRWLTHPGPPCDWFKGRLDDPTAWQPCGLISGGPAVLARDVPHETADIRLPWSVTLKRLATEAGVILLVALLTSLGCLLMPLALGHRRREAFPVAALALLPATLGLGAAMLAVFDPRLAAGDVYRGCWLGVAVGSVLLQWGFLAVTSWLASSTSGVTAGSDSRLGLRPRHVCLAVVLILLTAVGFWLRVRNITAEPLHHDEVWIALSTQGFLERGYPSFQIHPDLPPKAKYTSELTYVGNALAGLLFDDDRWVVRFPSVCFGTLTILLVWFVGNRLFGYWVGLIGAGLYAFSPHCIQMANFGRYFSQLQFFTLLTIYFFWRTIEGSGPIKRRMLWATAASFIAMFLSWEASALVAVGMIVAALIARRGQLYSIIGRPAVWASMLVVLLAVGLQQSHKILQDTKFLQYGTGTSDVALMPMWRYPNLEPWTYILEASWSSDALLPGLGLLAAVGLLMFRHPYRPAVGLLAVILLANCWIMAFFLPVKASRYSYHLIPLMILLNSAALVAVLRALVRPAKLGRLPTAWRAYGAAVAAVAAAIALLLAGGQTVQLARMENFRLEHHFMLNSLKFPDLTRPLEYFLQNRREGDILLASEPHMINHMAGRKIVDYWPESRLHAPAVLDDRRDIPLHRIWATEMLPNLAGMEDLLARNRRIWYIATPAMHNKFNEPETTSFFIDNMDVVYQDFSTVLFLGRDHHRLPVEKLSGQRALDRVRDAALPR